jgi:hypothetical protein
MSVAPDFHVFCVSGTFHSLPAEAVQLSGDTKQGLLMGFQGVFSILRKASVTARTRLGKDKSGET